MRLIITSLACVVALHAGSAAAEEKPKVKIAVLDLTAQGVGEDLAKTLTELMTTEISRIEGYSVMSKDDIFQILSFEQQKQLLGCTETQCLAEFGGILGAEKLIAGLVGKVGDKFVLNIKMIDIKKADVEKREDKTMPDNEVMLIESVKGLAYYMLTGKQKITKGTVKITSHQEGAILTLDGKSAGKTPLKDVILLTEGDHELVAQKEGFVPWKGKFGLKPEQHVEMEVNMVPLTEVGVNKYSLDTWGWIVLGTGVALGAGGTVAGMSAKSLHDDYAAARTNTEASDLHSKTKSRAALANILIFSAIGAGVASATLFATDVILERSSVDVIEEAPKKSSGRLLISPSGAVSFSCDF